MNIHTCVRCDGSGHVTGGYGWEIPWSRWAAGQAGEQKGTGILKAHVCPDCGGTGALLEFPPEGAMQLPWGGLRHATSPYAHHVAVVLQTQSMKPTVH